MFGAPESPSGRETAETAESLTAFIVNEYKEYEEAKEAMADDPTADDIQKERTLTEEELGRYAHMDGIRIGMAERFRVASVAVQAEVIAKLEAEGRSDIAEFVRMESQRE